MLSMNAYPADHIARSRARIAAQNAAYRDLVTAARTQAKPGAGPLDAALAAFEPVFFNDLVIALDASFVHRSRTLEGKDGNPLNEVRLLVNSLVGSDGVFTAEKAIKLKPDASVLGLAYGAEIAIREADFERLADAFFAEIEAKFSE